jgi:LAO/AO transport system kinase
LPQAVKKRRLSGGVMERSNGIVAKLLAGCVRSLARVITMVENEDPEAMQILQELYGKTGHAYVIGITGPPGSGKSTLTEKITEELRKLNYTVGIIAVDPTSPFSGGALLGDRLRMQSIINDEGVFVRSMATRGALGGLCNATTGTIKLMDAFGKDFIIVETVGVGQDEVDIVKTADTTLLVSVPGLGDSIQALKAGVMEIGDIFVVNKADREGADRVAFELNMMLDLNPFMERGWRQPVVKTVGTTGEGVEQLIGKIMEHKKMLEEGTGLLEKRKERVKDEIICLIERDISKNIHHKFEYDRTFQEVIEQITTRKKDPYSYSQKIARNLYQQKGEKKDS